MTDVALGQLATSEMMFAVILGLGLAVFNGGMAAVLPARSRGAWLLIMAAVQLAFGGLLILLARSTLSHQGGDIRYSIGVLFAAPVVIGGLIAVAIWVVDRRLSRPARRLEP
jgi:hypothetical protein